MRITTRRATIADIQLLRDINYSSFEANAAYDPHIDMNWVKTEIATKYFEEAVTKEDQFALVGQVDGVDVGYVLLEPKEINYRTVKIIEVGNMAVLPAYRSSGIGAILMNEAKEWAKKQGYQTMFVNAYIRNQRAVNFYEKQGFVPIDVSLEYPLT
jgi:diamine N-acetyltransferase